MVNKNEIVLFIDNEIELKVPITPEQETVWLTQEQMLSLIHISHPYLNEGAANAPLEERKNKKRSSIPE